MEHKMNSVSNRGSAMLVRAMQQGQHKGGFPKLGLAFWGPYMDITQIMQNQMKNEMENDMETTMGGFPNFGVFLGGP